MRVIIKISDKIGNRNRTAKPIPKRNQKVLVKSKERIFEAKSLIKMVKIKSLLKKERISLTKKNLEDDLVIGFGSAF